ncbi:hypothetical protein [Streptomyces litmocidini]|uniref:hypothetical protein n=1 Tax=Streptomyces litmocidini TaxID=67318 RepID=UPI0036F602E4
MLERAAHRIVVAESSELGRVRRAGVADPQASLEMLAALRRNGVRTTIAMVSTTPESRRWHPA